MKKWVAIACLAGLAGFGLAAGDVRFAIGEWAPYTGRQLDAYGLASQIVSAACRASGLEADYMFLPWKRAEAHVVSGICFATFPYQETSERNGTFLFSAPLYRSTNAVLLHRGNPRTAHFAPSSPEDLKDLRVGTLAGSDAVSLPLQRAGADIYEVQDITQNLMKLEGHRLDCVVDDRPVLRAALEVYCGKDLRRRDQFYFADAAFGPATEYRLMVSRRYPGSRDLLEKFNAGLRKLKTTGEYQRLLKQHGM